MKACKTVRGLLALRPSDWSEHERRRVRSHLETCPACAAHAQAYAAQEQLFRDSALALTRPPQWDTLQRRVYTKRRWGAMRSRLGAVLTSVAVVAAIIGLAWGLSTSFEKENFPVAPLQPTLGPATNAPATAAPPAPAVPTPTVPAETPRSPGAATPTAAATATAIETPTPQPAEATGLACPPLLEAAAFGYGIEAYAYTDPDKVFAAVNDLNLGWLKQEVRWADLEPARGEYDWATLDAIVEASREAGIKVLLSVTGAPAWARDGEPGVGPPKEEQDLAEFLGTMAARYRGKVQAYEIWHEQNMKRSWEGQPLSAEGYVALLRSAYHAIKKAAPEAIVVSGAPTPTGVNDGEWAIDDRAYLQQMYDAGLKDVCDAVGAHPLGYANPPDVLYTGDDLDPARAFDDHRSFFFRNTMEDYYQVMVANGDADKHIWVTRFGWGTPDGLGMEVTPGHMWVNDLDAQEQAAYIVGAYTWAEAWGHAGTMFLDNLNVSLADSDLGLTYSIVYQDWTPRPAYAALKERCAPSIPESALQGTGVFAWPAEGHIFERYGPRSVDGCWHGALDIAAKKGTPVYAADRGVVTFAGTRGGYGKVVHVDHLNGFVTIYAHLDVIRVSAQEPVDRGALLGTVGETGLATGPHLHFEIRERGVRVNPEDHLP